MKIKQSIFTATILIAMVSSSCHKMEVGLSKESMKDIVESRNTQLEQCFKSGNAERLAMMYTDSAKLSPNGSDFVYGRDSIKVFWTEDFKTSKVIEMNTTVLTIDGNSEILYETGITKLKIIYKDSLYSTSVKYINVWRKQHDGKYLLDVDFWNKPK